MIQILLHKQKLRAVDAKKLRDSGVVPIQTDDPSGFKLVDAELPQFSTNDLVWAFVASIDANQQYSGDIAKGVIKRLAQIATENREKKKLAKATESNVEP